MTELVARLRRAAGWKEIEALMPQLGRPAEKVLQALAEALLRVMLRADGQGLDCRVEILGQLAGRGLRLRHPGWPRIAEALSRAAPPALARGDSVPLLAATAALALWQGRGPALRWALARALEQPPERDAALHGGLWRCGLLRAEDDAAAIAAWTSGITPAQGTDALVRVLVLLGLVARRPMPFAQALVEGAALPWLLRAAAEDRAATALMLEAVLIEYWLKREESEDHYARWIGAWAPALMALGRRDAARLGPVAAGDPGPGEPRLAFIIHHGVLLAHTEVLLAVLSRWRAQGGGGFRPEICCLGEIHPPFRDAFSALGIAMRKFSDGDHAARLLAARTALAAEGVGAAIWLCQPHLLAYAAGFGLVQRLAWWSLKYHPPIEGPELLLRQGSGAPLAVMPTRGRDWLIMPMAFAVQPPTPETAAHAAALRATLPEGALVLSTVMREDKLDSPPFWQTVAEILRREPRAIWRYAGRQDLPGLRAFLRAQGLGERAQFIGWVDPAVEAALADLYLDGWPTGSGATAAQAMAFGKPYVWRCSDPAADSPAGLLDGLWTMPGRRGLLPPAEAALIRACYADAEGDLFRAPETAEQQAQWALDLLADPALRTRTGAACRRLAESVVTNPDRMAQALRLAAARLLSPPDACEKY